MPQYNSQTTINSTVLLRRITVFSFPPAFIMLLIHGISSGNAFPALGILPHAASVVFGTLLLFRETVASFGSSVQALSAYNVFCADIALTIWYFGFLIPTWLLLDNTWDVMIILGTYGSVFMMVNFAIHFYFAAAEALHIVTSRQSPFKSLAAEYTPLNGDYEDDLGVIEEAPIPSRLGAPQLLMLPSLVSTKYGRYKVNQDDLATYLAVTGTLCGAPRSLTKSGGCSSGIKSTRLKGKDRKLAKRQAADAFIDATTRQRAPKLELDSYVPLAEIIAKSTSIHSRVPRWVISIIDKIIQDRQDCFQHINGEDVATFLSKGQYDGHIHPINVLEKVRAILFRKYEKQVAIAQQKTQPKTLVKRVVGEISGNAFAKLKIDSPDESPSLTGVSDAQTEEADARDQAQADAWRKSLGSSQVFSAYPEASHEEALVALGSLRKDMISMREVVHEAWYAYKLGNVDLASAAVTTNTAIDLARSLESQARPVIESYMRTLDAKEIELPVYFYSLGEWVRDINGKTCGTNIYAGLLGCDPPDQAELPAELKAVDTENAQDIDLITFRWAYKLVQMYCMEFFSKTKKFQTGPDYGPRRWGKGERPDDAKLLEVTRSCCGRDIQWLYDLSWLGNYGYGPVFPVLDEVSRSFRVMHEEIDLKLWAVFGVQMFHEINLILAPEEQVEALQKVGKYLRDGFEMFRGAEKSYFDIYHGRCDMGRTYLGDKDSPLQRAKVGKTMLTCLFPSRVDQAIENAGHVQYPNLDEAYLMSQHPILCGILLHTGRLVMQDWGIAVEKATRSILKMAHFYNACCCENLLNKSWLDLEYCASKLQGPNLFMDSKGPDKGENCGKAYLLAAGAVSLTYAAPDCRDDPRNGRRNARGDKGVKGRKNNRGKTLQKLGKVSLMFEDRFCHSGERYDINEDDVRAIAEHAAVYRCDNKNENRGKPQSKTGRSAAKKPTALDEILRNLCHGLDYEVPMISFPYITLNADCSRVLWDFETQVQSRHHLLADLDAAHLSLGQIAVAFLIDHGSKMSIPAECINKHTKENANGGNDGMDAISWVFSKMPKRMRTSYPEEVHEFFRKNPSKTNETAKETGHRLAKCVNCVHCGGPSHLEMEDAGRKQDGHPTMLPDNVREVLIQVPVQTKATDGGEMPVAHDVDEARPRLNIVYQTHYERYD
ncbi:hypothetical protein VMCG_04141 [Cytospora schulzeri]|uniref:DUF6604 domain-containing protein n=1 Tax=Cytospora schulzeri TaxID=448051 RepID=A0A423WU67_9PEZI|nr:hypothetical protein VMCG_04141 [Valsa malicola]